MYLSITISILHIIIGVINFLIFNRILCILCITFLVVLGWKLISLYTIGRYVYNRLPKRPQMLHTLSIKPIKTTYFEKFLKTCFLFVCFVRNFYPIWIVTLVNNQKFQTLKNTTVLLSLFVLLTNKVLILQKIE